MKRKKPSVRVLFISDDIREEINDKISIIGLYIKNEMQLKIPGVLPKLCFQVFIDNVMPNDTFKMALIAPDGEEVLTFNPPPVEFPQDLKVSTCVLNLIATGIKIGKSGEYFFNIYFPNNGKAIKEKKIIFNNIS